MSKPSGIRKLTVPENLFRTGTAQADKESGTIRLSISSSEPYLRYDWWTDEEYYEVLSHEPGDVDMSRLNAGTPLLYNHKRDIQIGRNTGFEIKDGKCYVDAKVSLAPDVESYRIKIDEGILIDTSVGYHVSDEGECIGAKDGIPIYRFKWFPYEASMVTIPADISVGKGRQRDHNPECKTREITIRNHNGIDNSPKKEQTPKPMNLDSLRGQRKLETPDEGNGGVSVQVVEERERKAGENGVTQERARFASIRQITDGFRPRQDYIDKPLHELEAKALSEGMTPTDYKEMIITKHWSEVRRVDSSTETPAKMGLSKKDLRNFRLTKLMLEAADTRGKGVTGLEKEISESAASFYAGKDQRQFSGYCVPHDVAECRFDEVNDLNSRQMDNLRDEVIALKRSLNATVFSQGGALVGTDLLAGSFIEILRNAALIGQGPLGILELNGLVGNVAIPKQTGTTTVYWLAEGATITDSQLALAQLMLSPKRMGARTSFTKQLLAQASLSVEMLARNDIALAMGVEEDRVIINGAGGAEPLGIVNTTGVGANVTFGGAATWADMVNFEYQLENANVRNGQMVFLTTPLVKSYLKQTVVVSASTFPIFLWMAAKGEFPTINGVRPGIVNEYPAYATKNAPTDNKVIFGVFNNNVTKARWGGFDVVVDPFTGAASELIFSTFNQWLDVGIRYPQAFEVSTDAPTAP